MRTCARRLQQISPFTVLIISVSTVDSNSVVECAVAYDVDIAPSVKHDHFSVYVDVDPICINQKTKGGEYHRANRPCGTQKICKQSLGDEHKCAAFRSSMFDVLSRVHFHDVKNPADLDSTLNFINLKIRNESVRIFGTQKSAPRKPWMSEETFGIVRVASVLRRKMHTVRTQAKFFILRTLTCAWKAVVNEGNYICRSTFLSYITHKYMMHSAYLAHAIVCVRRAASLRIKQERGAFISGLAMQAEHAAFHNDLRNSYKIVRILGGKSKCNMSKAVKDRNGSIVSDAADVKLVWQDHFSRVFNASIARFDPSLFPHPSNVTKSLISPVYFDFDEVSDGIRSLGRNKGVGEDRNEAETLVAGSEPIARLLQGVMNASSRLSFAPSQWRGGRLIDLYKGKGDPSVTDNSRGLLIADHASKVFTGLLRKRVEPYYMSYIPREQFGCASARGTVFATHLLRSFIDYCSILSASFFVLFIDLSKAFDFAIREILLSWRQGFDEDKVAHLMTLGLNEHDAEELVRDLEHNGGLLEYLGCDASVCELINSVHTNSWFRVADLDTVIVSNRGGRQGCKIGGHIFNMIYARALLALRSKLRRFGITLRLKSDNECPFWAAGASAAQVDSDCPGAEEVAEAAFVDDECIFITASSPGKLDMSIDTLLSNLVNIFNASGFKINWAKGKTEALLKYRGKNAAAHMTARCSSGEAFISLPANATAPHVAVVSEYKHLGSYVAVSGAFMPDAEHRCSLAMNAFAPLAVRIFGAYDICIHIRIRFLESLVCSRLFYNTELWVIASTQSYAALRQLNKVYMHAARRVADKMRYGQRECPKDLEVRMTLGLPSIECRLRRRRLMYLPRLVNKGPASLAVLLSVRGPNGRRMPWAEQIARDLQILKEALPSQLCKLPDPFIDAHPWWHLIGEFPRQWRDIVSRYLSYESVLDVVPSTDVVHCRDRLVCDICTSVGAACKLFKSEKDLLQHKRIKHGLTSLVPLYIDDSGICPACGVNMFSRPKITVHACESRSRGQANALRCRDVIIPAPSLVSMVCSSINCKNETSMQGVPF